MKQGTEEKKQSAGAPLAATTVGASPRRSGTGVALRRRIIGLAIVVLAIVTVWLVRHGHGPVQIGAVLLAGIAAIVAFFQGMRGQGAVILSLLLIVPIFFRIGGSNLVDLPESAFNRLAGQTVPLGGALTLLVGAGLLLQHGLSWFDRYRSLLAAMGTFVLSGLVLLAAGYIRHGVSVNPLQLVQLAAPLVAVIPGLYAASRPGGMRHVIVYAKWGLLFSSLAILMQTIAIRGLAGLFAEPLIVRFGLLNIYQEADYVPFVFGMGLLFVTIAQAHFRRLAWHDLVYVGIVGLTFLGLYSRGAILCVAAGLAIAVVLARQEYRGRMMKLAIAFALVYMLGTILGMNGAQRFNASLGMVGSFVTTSSVSKAAVRIEEEKPGILEQDRSLRNRYLGLRQALVHLRYHPIGGSLFTPPTIPAEHVHDSLFTAKRQFQYLGASEFGSPHNQYLDITLRGGLLWLTAFLVLIATVLWQIWKISRAAVSPMVVGISTAVLCVLLSTLLIANFYQHNYAQPFSSFFLWYVTGLALAARNFVASEDIRVRS